MRNNMRSPGPRLHLPWEQWPEADRRLWQAAVCDDDPFSDAAGARLAQASRRTYWFGWRRFLGFLAAHDPAALDEAPRNRLSIDRVRSYAVHLAETNRPYSVAAEISKLHGAARIMMPKQDWNWLKAIKTRLFTLAPPSQPGPVITSNQLLDLGLRLMDESRPRAGVPTRLADAVQYRDGLMIALLACIPIRRRNLAALTIGRHLVRDGNTWSIVFARPETKTKIPLDYPVPEMLLPHLAIYLKTVRPRLLKQSGCEALWVGRWGGALSYSMFWPVITRHTLKHLGIRIGPHDARDASATTWAIAAPEQIGVARDLLGHSDPRSLTTHYNRAKGVEASRVHANVIAEMKGLRKARRSQPEGHRFKSCPAIKT
jgi:integrase